MEATTAVAPEADDTDAQLAKIYKFAGVTAEEYNALSVPQRVEIEKRMMDRPVSPDHRTYDERVRAEVMEEGAVVLHELFGKYIVRLPGGIIKKWNRDELEHEEKALRVVANSGIPVPCVHGFGTTASGMQWIAMDDIPGEILEDAWKNYSEETKHSVARQLGAIMAKIRALPPPPGHIGGPYAGEPGREIHVYGAYTVPPCKDERAFNAYLLDQLRESTPGPVREAFTRKLRTDHPIVFSHCDFAMRNIMVEDGQITGILDWAYAGWYPAYWEYVRFFQQNYSGNDFRNYAGEIFADASFPDEMISYMAMIPYMRS